MPSKFQFKEYCPLVFADLRAKFGVAAAGDFQASWTQRQPQWDCSQGRSGAKFLCAHNRRYVLRVIGCEEVEQVHQMLQAYHGYIVERYASTLLPQYLAMYRATVEDTHYYLLMMRSVFSPRFKVHRKYDLKGSTIDREASEKERSKELPTYKDVDFVNTGERIEVGPAEKSRILATLRSDAEFLERQNLMDYSLLVGVHDRRRLGSEGSGEGEADGEADSEGDGEDEAADDADAEAEAADGCLSTPPPDSPPLPSASSLTLEPHPQHEKYAVPSSNGSCLYFIGIISILTRYGVRKRTAQTYKSMKHGSVNENQISTVKPDVYARRFLDFIETAMQ